MLDSGSNGVTAMSKLYHHFGFKLRPTPPYDFGLTVRRPAGWSLFTPLEIYDGTTMWTTANLEKNLLGIRLSSNEKVSDPEISVTIFVAKELTPVKKEKIKSLLVKALGTDQDLSEFYEFSNKDSILTHVIGDLYGMHDTFSIAIFPEALLAIMLQMAPLKRSNEMMNSFIENYGDLAEFDGKKIKTWPSPEKIAGVPAEDIASKCRAGYRAKFIVKMAKRLCAGDFPSAEQLHEMKEEEAKEWLLELPGIGDYSADIINPHGGFPIDVWSAEVFGKLLFGEKPENNRKAVEVVKREGQRRWGKWAWMAFFYVAQDLENLSRKLGINLRLT
jgi:3-methyladenine DNA glycosylase/8-oxoguanine DNA glycosylase